MSDQQSSERYRGPGALHHEQTVAVVTHNGPDDTIDRLETTMRQTANHNLS